MAKTEDFSKEGPRRINRYFSESFKRKKAREIEKNISTVLEVGREYEVSTTAVYKWLDRYSRDRKRGVKQVVELMSDTRKIQELKNKIRDLEQLVGQKQFEIEFKDKMIDIAEEMYDIDIKKNLVRNPLLVLAQQEGTPVENEPGLSLVGDHKTEHAPAAQQGTGKRGGKGAAKGDTP